MKIVYTDYQVATVYECLEEDIEGKCTTSGTRVFLFSRTRTIPSFYRSNLESQLKLKCGDLSTLETVTGMKNNVNLFYDGFDRRYKIYIYRSRAKHYM